MRGMRVPARVATEPEPSDAEVGHGFGSSSWWKETTAGIFWVASIFVRADAERPFRAVLCKKQQHNFARRSAHSEHPALPLCSALSAPPVPPSCPAGFSGHFLWGTLHHGAHHVHMAPAPSAFFFLVQRDKCLHLILQSQPQKKLCFQCTTTDMWVQTIAQFLDCFIHAVALSDVLRCFHFSPSFLAPKSFLH